MSGRDAYAKRARADGEPQRRTQEHRLSIDTSGHWRGGRDLKGGCTPGTPRRRPIVRCVQNEDAQEAAVERRSAAEARTVHLHQRIRCSTPQHDASWCWPPYRRRGAAPAASRWGRHRHRGLHEVRSVAICDCGPLCRRSRERHCSEHAAVRFSQVIGTPRITERQARPHHAGHPD